MPGNSCGAGSPSRSVARNCVRAANDSKITRGRRRARCGCPPMRRRAAHQPDSPCPRTPHESDQLFVEIHPSRLQDIEAEQFDGIGAIGGRNVWQTVEQIAGALESVGIEAEIGGDATLPAARSSRSAGRRCSTSGDAISTRHWQAWRQVKRFASSAPIANPPAPGHSVSSNFGPRRDPFIGRPWHTISLASTSAPRPVRPS